MYHSQLGMLNGLQLSRLMLKRFKNWLKPVFRNLKTILFTLFIQFETGLTSLLSIQNTETKIKYLRETPAIIRTTTKSTIKIILHCFCGIKYIKI